MRHLILLSAILVLISPCVVAQEPQDIRALKLKDWSPKSMLQVKETKLDKPKFAAIDVHNHLGGGKGFLTPDRVAAYLEEMNQAGVRTVVNLDGGWGDRLKETLAALDEAHPDRFRTFALIDFSGIDDEKWTERETARLEESFKAGAKGLKFHKSLGLSYRYKNGKIMPVDDPKLAPIFELCGKHNRPVMIHTADPAAFFTPLDKNNERWHELNEHPGWLFYGEQFPKREDLLAQFVHVIEQHPKTTFIGAHFGNNVEDLATVGKWLDAYPNFHVDLDARISELGRQPYTARKFFLKYQDRIMFGTDTTPRREAFRIYYRFLETDDEYFDCAASHHLQGFWMVYGIYLPDEVLEKVYLKNAERILYGGEKPPVSNLKSQISNPPNKSESKPESKSGAKVYRVRRTEDFEVTGKGDASVWKDAPWEEIVKCREGDHPYNARFKVAYSAKGLYVLMDGKDSQLTATMTKDNLDLWNEDVFEVFLWPDESQPVYFEYEISPLGYELPILVPNFGKQKGWLPWHYEGERKIKKAVSISGGEQKSKASIAGWTAEFFIPYELLQPLLNVPPKSGSTWRANFYRMDYDDGHSTGWNWAPIGRSFHEYQKFGTLVFE
jgi:predicted TIM-barrel fold metal-dependent hydrolase